MRTSKKTISQLGKPRKEKPIQTHPLACFQYLLFVMFVVENALPRTRFHERTLSSNSFPNKSQTRACCEAPVASLSGVYGM